MNINFISIERKANKMDNTYNIVNHYKHDDTELITIVTKIIENIVNKEIECISAY